MVSEYTGDTITQVLAYPIDLYKAYLRAAYIYKLKQTKEGREYLAKAQRLSITVMDDNQYNDFKAGEDNKWLLI